jgi:hypothetical protein
MSKKIIVPEVLIEVPAELTAAHPEFKSETEPEPEPEPGSEFVIEIVPIPGRTGRKSGVLYRIGDLEAGSEQSFKVPAADENVIKITSSVRAYAARNGYRVIVRTVDGGIRVWRAKQHTPPQTITEKLPEDFDLGCIGD